MRNLFWNILGIAALFLIIYGLSSAIHWEYKDVGMSGDVAGIVAVIVIFLLILYFRNKNRD